MKEKMLKAQELIKQKHYEEARAILKLIDHPKAREWLAKLDEIVPEIPPTPASEKPKINDAAKQKPKIRPELSQFITDGQMPLQVEQLYDDLKSIFTNEEKLLYIAIQGKFNLLSPDCIALTNRRFIIYKPKFTSGMEMQDYIWLNLHDVRIREGLMYSTITLETIQGSEIAIDDVPKSQARHVYRIAQEMEEKMAQERRTRKMEESHAQAANINVQIVPSNSPALTPASPTANENPVEKLKQLKEMLDGGLITEQEYNAKKAEILSKM